MKGVALGGAIGLTLLCVSAVSAKGPPYPEPVADMAVYDTANALTPATEARAETIIDGIENRTGAEVVVYTQHAPDDTTTEEAEQDAIALIDQWGVGRRGFDDGLAILFDLYESDPCHGQVQLYAGPGYRATFLSNGERQAIFEQDMLPRLRECDRDGALLAALAKVEANATPEHARSLEMARQIDAVFGLMLAPVILLGTLMWGAWSWLRYGRDPVYLDDPSIHIPAAPPGLSPAAGALVFDGSANRRVLTTAMVDLASRGLIRFREESGGLFGLGRRKLGVEVDPAVSESTDPEEVRRRHLQERRPMSDAEDYARRQLSAIAKDGYIEPDDLPKFGTKVDDFNRKLETYVVSQGWFRERPRDAVKRWMTRGGLIMVLGGIALFGGLNLPSSGLTLIGIAGLVGGGLLLVLAAAMPARTMPGAMIRAMLAAYRRTLSKTMEQARSMGQVVDEAAIPLIQTADDAVVWGVALGLQDRVERVLQRTVEDIKDGRVTNAYMPAWYGSGASGGGTSGGGGGGFAPGLMSSSAIPNFGGMMAALSTIGNSPSSSGSSGGFGGGGSGGGGGGAGGGF